MQQIPQILTYFFIAGNAWGVFILMTMENVLLAPLPVSTVLMIHSAVSAPQNINWLAANVLPVANIVLLVARQILAFSACLDSCQYQGFASHVIIPAQLALWLLILVILVLWDTIMTQQAALSVLGVLYATLLLGIACNARLGSISLLEDLPVNIVLM